VSFEVFKGVLDHTYKNYEEQWE